MCDNLLQGYRIWLNEMLEVVEDICEGVVPAGHLDMEIYWRTKRLYDCSRQLNREGRRRELEAQLDAYMREGQQLFEKILIAETDLRVIGAGTEPETDLRVIGAGSEPESDLRVIGAGTEPESGEKSCVRRKKRTLTEENRIRLRRTYANEILNSLQILANLTFLLGEYLNCPVSDVEELFELGEGYEVKRVRSGVLII